MKFLVWLLVIISVVVWGAYGAHLLNIYESPIISKVLPPAFHPKTAAELGDALGILSSLLSPIALILALAALIIQSKQQAASNNIGALSVRQQYLISEYDRLANHIENLKQSGKYDRPLFDNMVAKQKRYRQESEKLDERINDLIEKI